MVKYKYLVPTYIRLGDMSLYAGYVHGKRLVVSSKPIKELEPYLIEVEGKVEKKTENAEKKYTKEELEALPYKKVQAIAKEMGLKYKGKKVELIERILNA